MFRPNGSGSGAGAGSGFGVSRERVIILVLLLIIVVLMLDRVMLAGTHFGGGSGSGSGPGFGFGTHLHHNPNLAMHLCDPNPNPNHTLSAAPSPCPCPSSPVYGSPLVECGLTLDIVVARFREMDEAEYLVSRVRAVVPNNTWIRVLTYNKYDSYGIVLPNVGRDPHTYLSHLIQYYDRLADVTVFVHGSFRSPAKFAKLETLLTRIKEGGLSDTVFYDTIDGPLRDEAGFELADWVSTHPGNREASKDQVWTRATVHPYGAWVRAVIGIDINNPAFKRSTHGTFAVGRRVIHRNPVAQYEKWRKACADGGGNGEVMHYMERSIHAILQGPNAEQ